MKPGNCGVCHKKMHRFLKFVLIKIQMIHLIMNEIVNKFLLPGDTFIPEMYLRQSEFTYSTCR